MEYAEVILINISSDGDTENQLTYKQLSCCPRVSYGNPQTIQDVTKMKGCSLQTDLGVPLNTINILPLVEHWKLKFVPI